MRRVAGCVSFPCTDAIITVVTIVTIVIIIGVGILS